MPYLRLFLIFLTVLATPLSAHSKIVGILFDTSGSMGHSDQLPAFGMQLLAGTIDGRAGHDRIVLMNFNHYMALIQNNPQLLAPTSANVRRVREQLPSGTARPIEILNNQTHQTVVDQVRRMFVSQPNLGTPYGPIEVMLATLADQVRDSEPAFLVVVSDGEYNEKGLPDRPSLSATFRTYKDRFPGGLRVEYLFIKPQNRERAAKLIANVDAQGVRDALLTVFNAGKRRADGTPVGAWTVSNGAEMWAALRDIIASVSGSDLAAQSQFVRYERNTVQIETPLSIANVVAVSTATATQAPAKWQSSTFDQQPTATRQIMARMDGPDAALDANAMHGLVQHYWFQNAVSAGQYEITFDRPVTDNVFLMFQTQAVTDLRVFDSQGTELTAAAGTPVRLLLGEEYTFQARIFDSPDGSPAPVDLTSLPPSLTMALQLTGPAGPGAKSMDIVPAGNHGSVRWTPQRRGPAQARSQAAIPGFLSPLSPSLPLLVVDPATALTVSPLQPTATCTGCTPSTLRSQIMPNGPDEELATFTVTADGDLNGAIAIDASDLPDYVQIRSADGLTIDTGTAVSMAAGETRTFSIWRLGPIGTGDLQGVADVIDFRISPVAPLNGAPVSVSASLTLDLPDLGMRLVAVTQPATPGALDGLVINGRELTRGNFYAHFALDQAVVTPDPALAVDTIGMEVDGTFGSLVDYTAGVADPRVSGILGLDVRPVSSFWCLCFLGLENWFNGSDRRTATVAYTDHLGLQSARSQFPLLLPIPWQQMGLSCALNLLYLLLLVMILRGIAAIARTNRFPRNAVVEVQDGRELPRFQRLRGNNYTWARVWLALFLGDPHEVRTVQGLRLTALADGAMLDLSGKSIPPWSLERMGQTFAEIKEQSRDLTSFRLGGRLINAQSDADGGQFDHGEVG